MVKKLKIDVIHKIKTINFLNNDLYMLLQKKTVVKIFLPFQILNDFACLFMLGNIETRFQKSDNLNLKVF